MDDAIKHPTEDSPSNFTVSFGISFAIASVASALLVVAKERDPNLMAAMKSATGHHWSTHSLFAIMLFLVVGLALTRVNGGQGVRMTSRGLVRTIVGGVIIGTLIVGGYYLFWD